jgi:hypothetical protein
MFEETGFEVVKLEPMSPFKFQVKLQIALLLGRGSHLFIKQIKIKAIRKGD